MHHRRLTSSPHFRRLDADAATCPGARKGACVRARSLDGVRSCLRPPTASPCRGPSLAGDTPLPGAPRSFIYIFLCGRWILCISSHEYYTLSDSQRRCLLFCLSVHLSCTPTDGHTDIRIFSLCTLAGRLGAVLSSLKGLIVYLESYIPDSSEYISVCFLAFLEPCH